MDPRLERLQLATRRHFLRNSTAGLGGIALNAFLADEAKAATGNPLALKKPQFPAKAKRVIYLHMTGSPPNLDMFDYKPELSKRDDQDCPDRFLEGKEFAFTSGVPKLMGVPSKVGRNTEKGAPGCRMRFPIFTASQTICAWSIRCTRTNSITRLPSC